MIFCKNILFSSENMVSLQCENKKIMFNQRGNWQFLPILKGGVSLPKLYENKQRSINSCQLY